MRPAFVRLRQLLAEPFRIGKNQPRKPQHGAVASRCLDGPAVHQPIVDVEFLERGEQYADDQHVFQNGKAHAQEGVQPPESDETGKSLQHPPDDGDQQDAPQQQHDESARRAHQGVEMQPLAHRLAEAHGEPQPDDERHERPGLHDESLAPPVPHGQRQHQTNDKVDRIHGKAANCG